MKNIRLKIEEFENDENVNTEQEFTHTVTDDEPDDVCDVFTYDEFKNWIEELMNNG